MPLFWVSFYAKHNHHVMLTFANNEPFSSPRPVYFTFVETKGKSLEEVDALFGDATPHEKLEAQDIKAPVEQRFDSATADDEKKSATTADLNV